MIKKSFKNIEGIGWARLALKWFISNKKLSSGLFIFFCLHLDVAPLISIYLIYDKIQIKTCLSDVVHLVN